MTYTQEETRPGGGRVSSPNGEGTARPKHTTQRDLVLRLLIENDEVCGFEFYRRYVVRYSSVIHRLRQSGFVIGRRPCDVAEHRHIGTSWLYRLEALPFDPSGGS